MGSFFTKWTSERRTRQPSNPTEATGTTDKTSTTDVNEQTEVTVIVADVTTGTADGGSANVTEETETVTQTVSAGEEGATVVIEKDTEIVESTTEAPHEDAEADEKLQTSTISIKEGNSEPIQLTLEGPLTKSQLISRASKRLQLFIIKFPDLQNQAAFLDTEDYSISYRDENITPFNWSTVMRFERSDEDKLKWTTLVMSKRYYTVTESQLRNPKEVTRKLVFEKHEDEDDIPLWTVDGRGQKLTFQNEETDGGDMKWFSKAAENMFIGRQVVGVENPNYTFHVYHVKGKDAKTIPYINIVP